MKNDNSDLSRIISLVTKKKGTLVDGFFLKQITQKTMGEKYSDKRYYKIIHHLKNKGYIYPLRKSLYLACTPDQHIVEDLVVDDHYWTILHKQIGSQFGKKRYIGGSKALELNVGNQEIPLDILVITPSKQAMDTVILDQKIQYKKYTSKGITLFKKFFKRTEKVKFGRYSFAYACLELALLETLYSIDDVRDTYQVAYVKKILKKTKHLDLDLMTRIMRTGKHHTSINRLYQLAKKSNPKLATGLYECIKKTSFVISV